MELSVGMYVRVKDLANICHIGKIYNINDFREPSMKYCIDIQASDFVFVSEEMIVKASHNIKELIEDDDLIKFKIYGELFICKVYNKSLINYDGEVFDLEELDIVSILTKEQYESMSYKVEE